MKRFTSTSIRGARPLVTGEIPYWLAVPFVLFGMVVCAYLVGVFLNEQRASGQPVPIRTAEVVITDPHLRESIQPEDVVARFAEPIVVGPRKRSPQPAENVTLLWVDADLTSVKSSVLELGYLRAEKAKFWLLVRDKTGDSGSPARQTFRAVDWHHAKSGVALPIRTGPDEKIVGVIGAYSRANTLQVTAELYGRSQFQESSQLFERQGASLLGAFASFAILAAIIGFRNRDVTFILFAGWLFTSFRVAAVNGGWDFYFFGFTPSWSQNLLAMRVSVAAFSILTLELFRSIFRKSLSPGQLRVCGGFRVVTLSHLIAAVVIPHGIFQSYFWATSGVMLIILLSMVASVFRRERSSVSFLYGVSWMFLLLGAVSEILSASNLTESAPFLLNMQVGSIASALVCAVALAERIRVERDGRVQAQKEAVDLLRKFRDTYDTVPVGLFSLNTYGMFLQFNPAFAQMLPSIAATSTDDPSDVSHRNWDRHFQSNSFNLLNQELKGQQIAQIEIPDHSQTRWFQVRAHRQGQLIEGSIEDITARRSAQERLRRLVDHDWLTDLFNRRGFEQALKHTIEQSDSSTPYSLAYVDLDRFKLINDMYGHASGDSVIKSTAERMHDKLPPPFHQIGRLGGDEFAIILNDCTAAEAKDRCVMMISAVMDKPFHVADKIFALSGSVGVIQLSPQMSVKEALSAADRACTEAKRHGGGQVVTYAPTDSVLTEHFEEMRMVAQMHNELPIDRMLMMVQPIVSLQTPYSTLSHEALLRLKDTNGNITGPFKLITAAERHGFMSKVDRWVLNHMITWMSSHPDYVEKLSYCAINLSGASLNDERFVQDVMAMIHAHPLVARKICFEITETVALYDFAKTRRFIERVRALGSKVALDDFGAGYTSFQYLKELKVDLIKIDGSFVKSLLTDQSNYTITRTIVDLSRELGMSCVAEWAERPEIIRALANMGVDYGQGFALAKPMSLDSVLAANSSADLVEDPVVRAILVEDREPIFRRPAVSFPKSTGPRPDVVTSAIQGMRLPSAR